MDLVNPRELQKTAFDTIINHLKQSRYFENMTNELLAKIIRFSSIRHYQDGEEILRQGQINHEVFFILRGKIAVLVDNRLIYHLSRCGDIFGELSFNSRTPTIATIKAVGNLEVAVLSDDLLWGQQGRSDHELHHVFYKWFARILSEKLVLTTQKAKLYEDVNKRIKSDLEVAKQVQHEMFSRNLTPIQKLPLSIKCEFMESIGGDLYGVFGIEQGKYGILLGDVSGHGTGASLMAMCVLNYFRHVSHEQISPEAVSSIVNDLCVATLPQNRFVTTFYAIYEETSQVLHYTNAGHHQAFLLRNGEVQSLPLSPGLPMGLFPSKDTGYGKESMQLFQGDRLLLFTDAIFESVGVNRKSMGLNKLANFIEKNAHLSSSEMIETVYRFGKQYSQSEYQDDFTFMIFDQL